MSLRVPQASAPLVDPQGRPTEPLNALLQDLKKALLLSGTPTPGAIVVFQGGNSATTGPLASAAVTHTGTLTDHAVIVGNGGADVSAIAALGTAGDVLTSAGAGADPVFSPITTSSTWTPVDNSGAALTLIVNSIGAGSGLASYTTVNDLVMVCFDVTYPATADTSPAAIGGLPFVATIDSSMGIFGTVGAPVTAFTSAGTSGDIYLYKADGTRYTNANLSGKQIAGCLWYPR